MHNDDFLYECSTCNKKFKTNTYLNKHQREGHNISLYPCTIATCQKTFQSKTRLNQHLRVHVDDRPYECLTCNNRFKCSGALKKHQSVHNKSYLRKKSSQCGQINWPYGTPEKQRKLNLLSAAGSLEQLTDVQLESTQKCDKSLIHPLQSLQADGDVIKS